MSCFKPWLLLLSLLLILFPCFSLAVQAFDSFCLAVAGRWQGTSAKLKQQPIATEVAAICSADKRQLLISVSRSARHSLSETWWFRTTDQAILLSYYDGVGEVKTQSFSLYQQGQDYSLLGEGELNQRPSMIKLRFEAKGKGWLWLQNVQYLDDDNDDYLFYRGIEMQPRVPSEIAN